MPTSSTNSTNTNNTNPTHHDERPSPFLRPSSLSTSRVIEVASLAGGPQPGDGGVQSLSPSQLLSPPLQAASSSFSPCSLSTISPLVRDGAVQVVGGVVVRSPPVMPASSSSAVVMSSATVEARCIEVDSPFGKAIGCCSDEDEEEEEDEEELDFSQIAQAAVNAMIRQSREEAAASDRAIRDFDAGQQQHQYHHECQQQHSTQAAAMSPPTPVVVRVGSLNSADADSDVSDGDYCDDDAPLYLTTRSSFSKEVGGGSAVAEMVDATNSPDSMAVERVDSVVTSLITSGVVAATKRRPSPLILSSNGASSPPAATTSPTASATASPSSNVAPTQLCWVDFGLVAPDLRLNRTLSKSQRLNNSGSFQCHHSRSNSAHVVNAAPPSFGMAAQHTAASATGCSPASIVIDAPAPTVSFHQQQKPPHPPFFVDVVTSAAANGNMTPTPSNTPTHTPGSISPPPHTSSAFFQQQQQHPPPPSPPAPTTSLDALLQTATDLFISKMSMSSLSARPTTNATGGSSNSLANTTSLNAAAGLTIGSSGGTSGLFASETNLSVSIMTPGAAASPTSQNPPTPFSPSYSSAIPGGGVVVNNKDHPIYTKAPCSAASSSCSQQPLLPAPAALRFLEDIVSASYVISPSMLGVASGYHRVLPGLEHLVKTFGCHHPPLYPQHHCNGSNTPTSQATLSPQCSVTDFGGDGGGGDDRIHPSSSSLVYLSRRQTQHRGSGGGFHPAPPRSPTSPSSLQQHQHKRSCKRVSNTTIPQQHVDCVFPTVAAATSPSLPPRSLSSPAVYMEEGLIIAPVLSIDVDDVGGGGGMGGVSSPNHHSSFLTAGTGILSTDAAQASSEHLYLRSGSQTGHGPLSPASGGGGGDDGDDDFDHSNGSMIHFDGGVAPPHASSSLKLGNSQQGVAFGSGMLATVAPLYNSSSQECCSSQSNEGGGGVRRRESVYFSSVADGNGGSYSNEPKTGGGGTEGISMSMSSEAATTSTPTAAVQYFPNKEGVDGFVDRSGEEDATQQQRGSSNTTGCGGEVCGGGLGGAGDGGGFCLQVSMLSGGGNPLCDEVGIRQTHSQRSNPLEADDPEELGSWSMLPPLPSALPITSSSNTNLISPPPPLSSSSPSSSLVVLTAASPAFYNLPSYTSSSQHISNINNTATVSVPPAANPKPIVTIVPSDNDDEDATSLFVKAAGRLDVPTATPNMCSTSDLQSSSTTNSGIAHGLIQTATTHQFSDSYTGGGGGDMGGGGTQSSLLEDEAYSIFNRWDGEVAGCCNTIHGVPLHQYHNGTGGNSSTGGGGGGLAPVFSVSARELFDNNNNPHLDRSLSSGRCFMYGVAASATTLPPFQSGIRSPCTDDRSTSGLISKAATSPMSYSPSSLQLRSSGGGGGGASITTLKTPIFLLGDSGEYNNNKANSISPEDENLLQLTGAALHSSSGTLLPHAEEEYSPALAPTTMMMRSSPHSLGASLLPLPAALPPPGCKLGPWADVLPLPTVTPTTPSSQLPPTTTTALPLSPNTSTAAAAVAEARKASRGVSGKSGAVSSFIATSASTSSSSVPPRPLSKQPFPPSSTSAASDACAEYLLGLCGWLLHTVARSIPSLQESSITTSATPGGGCGYLCSEEWMFMASSSSTSTTSSSASSPSHQVAAAAANNSNTSAALVPTIHAHANTTQSPSKRRQVAAWVVQVLNASIQEHRHRQQEQ